MASLEITDKEYRGDRVEFSIGDIIKVIIDQGIYQKLAQEHSDEVIISASEEKTVLNKITGRELVYVSESTEIPLYGHIAFGIIDRGTNLIQVRPLTGCNLNCIFCSACEGPSSSILKTDYVVDIDYLMKEIDRSASRKDEGVEIHIDGQGEPGFYPRFKELVERSSELKEVDVVSVQSNGFSLEKEDIRTLEGKLDRINLSLNTLDSDLAKKMSGISGYDLDHVKGLIKKIIESEIDLLIAPVWIPGFNDDDILEIIEFSIENLESSRWPSLGIQKYIPYKHGRKPDVEVMSFYRFYQRLKELEEEFDTKLKLTPDDFDMNYRPSGKKRFGKGEKIKARIRAPGRKKGEMLAVAKDRAIAVETEKKEGEEVICKLTRTKHDIYRAVGV